jgi:hypothetical protein
MDLYASAENIFFRGMIDSDPHVGIYSQIAEFTRAEKTRAEKEQLVAELRHQMDPCITSDITCRYL